MLKSPVKISLMYFKSTLDSRYLFTGGFPLIHSRNLKDRVSDPLVFINVHSI